MAQNDVVVNVSVNDNTAQGFNSATQNANQAGNRIRTALADTAGNAAGALSGRLGAAGEALGQLGPAGAAAGAAIGAGLAAATVVVKGLKKALDESIERASTGALAAVQTGMTDPEQVARLGKLAGKVYADNFGESLQEAGQAVRDVIRNKLVPADAGDAAVKAVAERLLTVGTVVEGGSAEVARSVHKLLVTDLVGSADEAFDLITVAAQQGVGEAGDLLETLSEYSIQFKELGISGKDAMGLIAQGLAAGARDGDVVADTLKEIAIIAQDGSKKSGEAFKMLGLDARQLGQMFAGGGAEARKAFDLVLDKTKMIKDPMERNAVATALFGTKAEDLQDALFGLDLDTAAAGLGKIEGAADRASTALGSGLGPMIETFKRKTQQLFADIGDKITPIIMGAVEAYKGFAAELAGIFEGSEVPGDVMESLRKVGQEYGPALKEALGHIADKLRENKPLLEKIGRVLADDVIPAFGVGLVNGLKAASIAIGGIIEGFGLVMGVFATVRNAAIDMALTFINNLDVIVQGVVKAAALIPGPFANQLKAAANEFHEFVDEVNNTLKNIRDEDVYVRTHFVGGQGQSRGGDYRTGGITGAMSYAATGGARGGLVMVGEEGRELLRTPQGSMVYPKANANQFMTMAGQGGGGAMRTVVEFAGDLDSAMAQWFMNAQRSGQVQIYQTAIV